MKDNILHVTTNAYFGDGCITMSRNSIRNYVYFSSTNLDYLLFKREMCKNMKPTEITLGVSGYGGKKPIYRFCTRVSTDLTSYFEKGFSFLLDSMDMQDLVMFYLDDGSVHRTHGSVHLYCNSFNDEETLAIMAKVDSLLGNVAPCRKMIDRKPLRNKEYNYIYIPRIAAEHLLFEVENFIDKHSLESIRYKVFYKSSTLNDHRKTDVKPRFSVSRLKEGKYTLESSRVELRKLEAGRLATPV